MIIESVSIKNFRSIFEEVLYCDNLTVLVGANGTGKSSFLRGIELFYSPTPKIDHEDFFNRETSVELVVTLTFIGLSKEATELFSSYIQNERLTVERVFTFTEGKLSWKYHGASWQHPGFHSVRSFLSTKGQAKNAKEEYNRVRSLEGFGSLAAWSNAASVESSLRQFESDNENECIRQRDDGQFFGFKEVAQGYLGRYTKLLFIPAVRDAEEDTQEGKNSVFSSLMDLVVRSVIASKESMLKLKEDTRKQYKDLLDPTKLTELTTLSDKMSKTLKTFVPSAGIVLQWQPLSDIDIPLPKATVNLVEDGYSSGVARTGHGLQRAFILTMLQHLALAQSQMGSKDEEVRISSEYCLPDMIIAIEEPELYQHPSRQRHLANVLLKLAAGKTPGVADKTQIIYATHSPLFVGIDRTDNVRLLRKKLIDNERPKATQIIRTSLEKVAENLNMVHGEKKGKFSRETLLPRLRSIMTPWMGEGFFADVVVLVEGEGDRAAILGVAKTMGHDLESMGVSVIPSGGKTCIDRPAVIFKQLEIPTYLVWDSDKGEADGNPKHNHALLRILGESPEDWPSRVTDSYACFEVKLENTISAEIGENLFEKKLIECKEALDIAKRKDAIKNPTVISTVIEAARKEGKQCGTIEAIVENIIKLARHVQPVSS